jgi:hypothetical protein
MREDARDVIPSIYILPSVGDKKKQAASLDGSLRKEPGVMNR